MWWKLLVLVLLIALLLVRWRGRHHRAGVLERDLYVLRGIGTFGDGIDIDTLRRLVCGPRVSLGDMYAALGRLQADGSVYHVRRVGGQHDPLASSRPARLYRLTERGRQRLVKAGTTP